MLQIYEHQLHLQQLSYLLQILGELEKKLLDYKLRYKLALKKKIEMMRLKYEKCMSLRVFKEPMQQINEKYILIDKQVRNLKEYITNKLKSEKIKETRTD